MFLKFKAFAGPSSFTFKDPDTGREFSENSKEELLTRIVSYRSQNNLEEIERLPFILENYWCSLPENIGLCEETKIRRGLMGYIKGGLSLIKNVAYGAYSSIEVAEERARICKECPSNIWADKPAFMEWSDKFAYHAIGDRKTSSDKNLGSCEICSCPLRSKVWIGKLDKFPKEINDKLPDYCWQKD